MHLRASRQGALPSAAKFPVCVGHDLLWGQHQVGSVKGVVQLSTSDLDVLRQAEGGQKLACSGSAVPNWSIKVRPPDPCDFGSFKQGVCWGVG